MTDDFWERLATAQTTAPLERTLDDGRILILYARPYNWMLTVSTPESFAQGFHDDSW